jgi:acetyl esterase
MSMDSQLAEVLAGMAKSGGPSLDGLTPQGMRPLYAKLGEQLGGQARRMAEIKALSAPGPAGNIPLRLYRPVGLEDGALHAALIYLHGGGWVIGDLDTHDRVCRRLADTCGCIIVAVDYRLAPEHPFPAGPEDAIAASRWILDNALELGLDNTRIGIAGDSAGGSLSAVACLGNRELPGPRLCCQVLIYPSTDNSPEAQQRPSRIEQAQTPPLGAKAMQTMVSNYLPDPASGYDWRASPLLAKDHSNLPPALLITGGYDPLRDEDFVYAQCLAKAGGEVMHRHYPGLVHGFIEMGGVLDAVEDAMQTIAFWFGSCCGDQ